MAQAKYKAVRSFKVQGADGKIRICQPGDPIPEAETWRNLKAYIEREWVCRVDEEPDKRHYTAKVTKPAKAALKLVVESTEPAGDGEGDGEPTGDGDVWTEKELNAMTKADLKELAEEYEVDPDQNKAELVAAILAE